MPRKAQTPKQAAGTAKNPTGSGNSGNWHYKGGEGFSQKRQQDEIQKMRKEKSVPRFRLGPGDEAKIIFLDSTPFFIHEHNLQLGGRYGNFFTCVKEYMPCPICQGGHKSTFTAYLTAIDTREFTRNDGTKVKNTKVLYPAKGSQIARLEEVLKKKGGNIVGMAFDVKRYTPEDPNCGASLSFDKKVDLSKIKDRELVKPFDYMKILAPPSEDEYESLHFSAGSGAGAGSKEPTAKPTNNIDDLI